MPERNACYIDEAQVDRDLPNSARILRERMVFVLQFIKFSPP